jgi:hypothetical protein
MQVFRKLAVSREELRQRIPNRFATLDAIVERSGRDGSPHIAPASATQNDYAREA